jgi:hypothetical protein
MEGMPKEAKATTSWNKLIENLDGTHAKRFDAILHTMDDEEFAKNFIKILEFGKPKLQRSEIIDETPESNDIRIENVVSQTDKEENGVSS